MTSIILPKSLAGLSRKIQTGIGMLFLLAATQTSIAQTPFTCTDQVSYVTKAQNTSTSTSTELYQVDLMHPEDHPAIPIAVPLIVPVSGNKVNGIGYNVLDNFIWGSATGTSSIVKIGSDGIVQSFPVPGLPAANYTSGDVDQAGNLYLYVAGATVMYKINVTTLALSTITLSAGSTIFDISVNATGTKIFGITNPGDLATYTVSGTNATLEIRDVEISVTPVGFDTFLDSRGYLYAHYSLQGETYLLNPLSASPEGIQVSPRRQLGYPSEITTTGDGARCPTSEIVVQPPVSCEGVAYTLNDIGQNGTCHSVSSMYLYKTDFQTGVRTEIGTGMTNNLGNGHLNSMAYNPKDGYLWAFRMGTSQMVRIGADGSTKYFPLEGFITDDDCGPSLFAADIDKNGVMYAIAGRPSNTLIRIDLNPASPTFLTVLSLQTLTNMPGGLVADIAFNPKDHFLYGISTGQHAYRIDPLTAVATDLGATGVFSSSFNVVSDLFDAAGNLYYQIGSSFTLFKIKDINLGNTTAVVYKNDLAPPGGGDGASCGSAFLAGVRISGNVWDDANGNLIKAGGELNTITDDPTQSLTIYLTDTDGLIVATTSVGSDGTWFIDRVPDGTFNVTLSNDASLLVGTTLAIPATLPGNGLWVTTGINFPGATGAQAGTNTGSIVVGTTLDITEINFGIEKKPTADTKTFALSKSPAGGSIITLNGTWPFSVAPTQITGADYEDGAYDGVTGNGPATSIQIISVPVALDGPSTGGDPELYYNGILITAGQTINNYDQNNLTALINGRDYKGLSFTYQTIDAAGVHSQTATYAITWQDALPVKLISFDATKEQNIARLSWVTSEEINADRFEVEKSADAKAWIKIGSLDAAGESRTRLNYVFEDNMPQGGNNYYRLKMIDNDATYTYSRLVHLVFDDNSVSVMPYPNPVVDRLFLTGVTPGLVTEISIISTSGRTVYNATGTSLEGVDVKSLPSGLYVVKFTLSNGIRGTNKIVISR